MTVPARRLDRGGHRPSSRRWWLVWLFVGAAGIGALLQRRTEPTERRAGGPVVVDAEVTTLRPPPRAARTTEPASSGPPSLPPPDAPRLQFVDAVGSPVAGVKVHAPTRLFADVAEGTATRAPASTTTGPDGRASLASEPGDLWVARAPGHPPLFGVVHREGVREVVLPVPTFVAGVVVDPSGAPIRGARVVSSHRYLGAQHDLHEPDERLVASDVTDAAGAFRVPTHGGEWTRLSLSAGRYLTLPADNPAGLWVRGGSADVRIVARAVLAVFLRLRDAETDHVILRSPTNLHVESSLTGVFGAPEAPTHSLLRGVRVASSGATASDPSEGIHVRWAQESVGVAEAPRDDARVRVVVEIPGYARGVSHAVPSSLTSPMLNDIHLRRAPVRPTGALDLAFDFSASGPWDLPTAPRVQVELPEPSPPIVQAGRRIADQSWRFEGLPAGACRVRGQWGPLLTDAVELVVPPDGTVRGTATFVQPTGVVVHATDADGADLPWVRVVARTLAPIVVHRRLHFVDGSIHEWVETRPEGHTTFLLAPDHVWTEGASLHALPPGRYSLVADHPGLLSASVDVEVRPGVVESVRFRLRPEIR